jgi:Domain of unknown function (DUF5069)
LQNSVSVSKATGDLSGTVNAERLRSLALDLNRTAPRSPRAALTNFPAVAARLVDKCRAELVGRNGGYHYKCPMDRKFLAACGLDADALREFIATGANDTEVAVWMRQNAASTQEKITDWTRRFLANPVWRLLDLEDWLHVRASSRKQSR